MNAVVVVNIGDDFNQVFKVSKPTIKKYADKIKAELVIINKPVFHNANMKHWEKLQIYELLKKYHRVLYVDVDLIIRDDCPNLFDIVPDHKIGLFNEGMFDSRLDMMLEACKLYKIEIPKWEGTYYNSGVMVISRKQRQLFKPPSEMYDMMMGEQSYLNVIIQKRNIPVHELKHEFNRMTLIDQITGEPRQKSYIIHYAGCPSKSLMVELMNKDLQNWKENKPNYEYKRNVVISVGGGLGDEIDAEPVVREIIERSYKDENITIATWWPRIFEHYSHLENVKITSDPVSSNDEAQYWMHTMPDTRTSVWKVMSHPLLHTIDFASLSCLRTILPSSKKQIRLKVNLEDVAEVVDIIGLDNNENLLLIHPGKGWESKTFPAEWWNEVILELSKNKKLKICIIGMRVSDEQGTVDIDVPDNVIDLRDMLSLGGLFAVISMSHCVLSNDSAPVHIAGAFTPWIVLIPTCKHPEHILPWRNGRQDYKAVSLYRKLTCDAIDNTPTQIYGQTIDYVIGDITDYLPLPQDVVDKVNKLF